MSLVQKYKETKEQTQNVPDKVTSNLVRHPCDEGDLSPEKYVPWSLHSYEVISEPQMEMFLSQHPAKMLRACSCARGNQLQTHNKTLLEDYFSAAAFFSSCSKSSFLRRENKCGFPISKILLH